jgi:hypothetical protein
VDFASLRVSTLFLDLVWLWKLLMIEEHTVVSAQIVDRKCLGISW